MQYILRDDTLGKNIRRVRMLRKLTQAETVLKLQEYGVHMTRETLANIESGRRNIKARDLKALKKVLDTEYEEFFKEGE